MACKFIELNAKSRYDAYVSYVISPEEFWIQLVDGERDLQSLMANLNSHQPPAALEGPITPMKLYAAKFSEDGCLYRVRVTGKRDKDTFDVQFVDYGNSEPKSRKELQDLDARYAQLPCQAVMCHLKGVSTSGTSELQALVLTRCVTVVVLSEENNSYAIDMSAEGVPSVLQHLRNIYPKAIVAVPAKRNMQYGSAPLPPFGKFKRVIVSYSHGPLQFWVNAAESIEVLENLNAAIAKHVGDSPSCQFRSSKSFGITPGMPCLAQSGVDACWYRAQVVSTSIDGELTVHFVDYGNTEVVPVFSVRELPLELLEMLPCAQALECTLANITIPERAREEACSKFNEVAFAGPIDISLANAVAPGTKPVPVNLGAQQASTLAEFFSYAAVGAGEPKEDSVQPLNPATKNATKARLGYRTMVLPEAGAKIAATAVHVVSPSKFWCHFRVHEADMRKIIEELKRCGGLACAFDDAAQSTLVGRPCCAKFSRDGLWYRARVQECSRGGCVVEYVDYGNSEFVSFGAGLAELPSSLLVTPPQAIRCCLASPDRGQSKAHGDKEEQWSMEECTEFDQLVLLQPLQLIVRGREGDCLIVDVLTQAGHAYDLVRRSPRSKLPHGLKAEDPMTVDIPVPSPKRETPAEKSPGSYAPGLLSTCSAAASPRGADDRRTVPGASASKEQFVKQPVRSFAGSSSTSLAAGTSERIRVVWIVSPDQFYIHKDSSMQMLHRIAQGVTKSVEAGHRLAKPAAGLRCVARYQGDGQWYRADISAVAAATCMLYFIDYGNTGAATFSDVFALEPSSAEIPPQAVCCKLRGIVPSTLKGEWTDEVRDKMELLVASGELYATFVTCHRDSHLVDLSIGDGSSVADELIAAGLAKPVRGDVVVGASAHYSPGSSGAAVPRAKGSSSASSLTKHSASGRQRSDSTSSSGDVSSSSSAARRDAVADAPSKADSGSRRFHRKPFEHGSQAASRRPRGAPRLEHNASSASRSTLGPQRRSAATNSSTSGGSSDSESVVRRGKRTPSVTHATACVDGPKATGPIAPSGADSMPAVGGAMNTYLGLDVDGGVEYAACICHVPPHAWDRFPHEVEVFVQLHRDGALLDSVQEGIQAYVSHEAPHPPPGFRPHPGAVCLAMYDEDSNWYRAEVIALDAGADSVVVLFVDYGNSETVALSKVRCLPESLLRAGPRLAVHCKVDDITSLAGVIQESTLHDLKSKLDGSWVNVVFTPPVNGNTAGVALRCVMRLQQPLSSDTVAGVVHAAGALHLDDDGGRQPQGESEKTASTDDPNGTTDTSDLIVMSAFTPAELEQGVEYETALSSHGSGQGEFWLQLRAHEPILQELAAEIERVVAEAGKSEDAFLSKPPTVGATCLARYSADGLWYRAEAITVHPDTDTAEVLYVDYGNTDIVQWPSRNVLHLPGQLGSRPCCAIQCMLSKDSPASLQDYELATDSYMTTVFFSVPATIHDQTLCHLLPPKRVEEQEPSA